MVRSGRFWLRNLLSSREDDALYFITSIPRIAFENLGVHINSQFVSSKHTQASGARQPWARHQS